MPRPAGHRLGTGNWFLRWAGQVARGEANRLLMAARVSENTTGGQIGKYLGYLLLPAWERYWAVLVLIATLAVAVFPQVVASWLSVHFGWLPSLAWPLLWIVTAALFAASAIAAHAMYEAERQKEHACPDPGHERETALQQKIDALSEERSRLDALQKAILALEKLQLATLGNGSPLDLRRELISDLVTTLGRLLRPLQARVAYFECVQPDTEPASDFTIPMLVRRGTNVEYRLHVVESTDLTSLERYHVEQHYHAASAANQAIRSGEVAYCPDVEARPGDCAYVPSPDPPPSYCSLICVPVRAGDDVLGVLAADSPIAAAFDDWYQERVLIHFAQKVAVLTAILAAAGASVRPLPSASPIPKDGPGG